MRAKNRDRQREVMTGNRQADRRTERQTNRQRQTEADRQHRQSDRLTDRMTGIKETDRNTYL